MKGVVGTLTRCAASLNIVTPTVIIPSGNLKLYNWLLAKTDQIYDIYLHPR